MDDTSANNVTKTDLSEAPLPPAQTPYTVWTVFKRRSQPHAPTQQDSADFEDLVTRLSVRNVTVRGCYDVSAMRNDADVMVWLVGAQAEELQSAIRAIRRSALFANTEIAFSAMGVHREAEFAKSHVPSYMVSGIEPKQWVCVYPFVRSYEWYILDPKERGRMLREHGLLGREFPQVLANTVSGFALGDWEWLLGLEADDVADLVDLMRHLRNTDARLHVREEIPFYTGRRIDAHEIAEVLS